MRNLQRYIFGQLLAPLILSCAALTTLALLTQSLANVSLIVDEGESLLLVLRITLLTMPQLMGLVLPIALFIALAHSLHRLHTDSELVVAATSGLSRWGMASPALRLTALVMVAHLALGLWLQPFSHREMRRTLHEARVEIAAGLVAPGEFTAPADDLTIFISGLDPDGALRDVLIEDARQPDQPVTYLAEHGRLVESATTPAVVLETGSMMIVEEDGRLSFLEFDSWPVDLSNFIEPPGQLFYKLSDRYLHELFFPNMINYWERDNRKAMAAEGHARLAAPLYDFALAAIAILALLGGDFSRTGYGWRIMAGASAALGVRLAGFAVEAGSASEPALTPLQYILPAAVGALALAIFLNRRRLRPYWRRMHRPLQAA